MKNKTENIQCCLCDSDNARPAHKMKDYTVCKCADCGLQYINPRLREDELKKLYTEEYFDEFQKDNEQIASHSLILNRIEKYKPRKGNFLDIGCARGNLIKLAKEREWNVFGVEFAKNAADFGRKEYGLNIFNGDLEAAKFRNNFFDVVTIFNVLEHVPNPAKTVMEIRRILKPDGLAVIIVPNLNRIYLRQKPLSDDIFSPLHLHYFTPKTLTKLLRKEGFKVVELKAGALKAILRKLFIRKQLNVSGAVQSNFAAGSSIGRSPMSGFLLSVLDCVDIKCGHSITVYARKS